MINHRKKQILAGIILMQSYVIVVASEAEQKVRAAISGQKTTSAPTKLPKDIQKSIDILAGEYQLFKTLNTPGARVAFQNNQALTSVGSTSRTIESARHTPYAHLRATDDAVVTTRNIMNGAIIYQFTKELIDPNLLMLSGDGKVILDSHNILDTTTRDVLAQPPAIFTQDNRKYTPLCLNYDGTMFALGSDSLNPIILFDRLNKKSMPLPKAFEYNESNPTPIFSRDGTIFACVSRSHDHILLFDTKTSSLIQQIKTTISDKDNVFRDQNGGFYYYGITSLAINQNNSHLIYSTFFPNRSEAILVSRATEELTKIAEEKPSLFKRLGLFPLFSISRVGFTNTGNNVYLLLFSKDHTAHLQFRNWTSNTLYQSIQLPEADPGEKGLIPSIALSPDDQSLAVGSPKKILLFKRSNPVSDLTEKKEKLLKLREKRIADTEIARKAQNFPASKIIKKAIEKRFSTQATPSSPERQTMIPNQANFSPQVEPED